MQNFIPDRRAVPSEKKSPPAPAPQIYTSAWLREQKATTPATTNDPQPSPAPHQQENEPGVPASPASPGVPRRPEFAPGSTGEAPRDPASSQSTFAKPFSLSEAPTIASYVPGITYVPDLRVPFSIKKNPFARPR